jgi:hypothetical protein
MNSEESIIVRCADIVKKMAIREIPNSLDIKTRWMLDFLIAEKHNFSVTGLLLASARRDNFVNDKSGWVKWADENFDLEIAERSHRNKFGMLLIAIPDDNRVEFERLFKLDKDKAVSITRFIRRENIDEIKPMELKNILVFLAEHVVETMTRDEVRDAVEEAITGKTKVKSPDKGQVIQPTLPGLFESIDAICSYDLDEIKKLSRNPKFTDEKGGQSIVIGVELLAAGIDQHENKNLSLQAPAELIEELKDKAYRAYKKLEFWSVNKTETMKNAG